MGTPQHLIAYTHTHTDHATANGQVNLTLTLYLVDDNHDAPVLLYNAQTAAAVTENYTDPRRCITN
jgi:hypothetical protein